MVRISCLLALLGVFGWCQPASAADTDGLVFGTGLPAQVNLPGQQVANIKIDGTTDKTKYPKGLILDQIVRVQVYQIVGGMPAAKPLYDDMGKKVKVNGLTSWTGTTAQVGGFPAGQYQVVVSVQMFKPDGNTPARPANITTNITVKFP